MQLIPAIDLRGGRCVRLLQGRFDAETVYADDPVAVLEQYVRLGASHVHVVDLDAARGSSDDSAAAVGRLLSAGLASLQLGGGVRSRAAVARWLELGVRRVVIGSIAATDPELTRECLRAAGGDRVVLAFDVRLDAHGTPRLTTHGWETQTETSLWAALERYLDAGLRHVLCTDVARDGALSGPNVALYAEAATRYPSLAWQASGGVSGVDDLDALAATGVASVISGRALLEGRLSAQEIEPYLRSA
jgi:phosphoribosylformimino-5-aminoimidazole carboxamide ribotide isomerase